MKNNNSLNLFEQRMLLFSVFILSICAIIYELVLGSLATYLLGNPVMQYSITIGVFLSSMGFGSYLSRFFLKNILRNFILIEISLGLVGGISILFLNFFFSFSASFYLLHIFFLMLIGTLAGLEIPLLTRILKKYGALKDILSNVLSFDYLGGLAGSLLFPLLLFPFVGRLLTSIFVGLANIFVALILMVKIDYEGKKKSDLLYPVFALILLVTIAFFSDGIMKVLQKRLYYDDIVFSKRSKYQQIVLTRNGSDFRLYLDGSLQFSTYDDYRYHEMLVFPALNYVKSGRKSVLVLGGGDGIAVKEIQKMKSVSDITLVELDPAIIELAKNNSSLKRINNNSLNRAGVNVVVADAYVYLMKSKKRFNVIIADFPDPHDETISKLYTIQFFNLIKRSLAPGGVFVTQSTSPLFAKEAFWCINKSLKAVFKNVIPYHVYIPTFGDWGFNLATQSDLKSVVSSKSIKYKFYSNENFQAAKFFPADSITNDIDINTFNKPLLYTYYIKGWKTVDY